MFVRFVAYRDVIYVIIIIVQKRGERAIKE